MDAVPTQTKTHNSYAAILAMYCAGEVLLVQGAEQMNCGLPGGNLRPGEKPAIGIRRKVFEETGFAFESFSIEMLGAEFRKEDSHTLYFFGVLLPPNFFAELPAVGPKGHRLWLCKCSELMDQNLRRAHRRLLQKLSEKQKRNSTRTK